MLFRNCAGGVVFFDDKVLLLKNEKDQWVLPKGVIRNGSLSRDVALTRVKEETGVEADIISCVGETCYEFFSMSRQKPVCNEITWYLMRALEENYQLNEDLGFRDIGFYDIDVALNMITHNQDKSLVNLAYRKYKTMFVEEMMV
ncbi:NUDIX hydrolase [Crassaminicella profunda]|uniref:NUDIX hydrolase n=1 Tax=Crassaminicella profunda TaxID=1286698 RepID=UPI001CA60FE5|nr:NUDIX hydrolase [Crassaminicella profunda]QZY56502.1 NUDIX hydrolase [Crassaminicella profunda]